MMICKSLLPAITALLLVSPTFGQEWRWERHDEMLNRSGIKTTGLNAPSLGDFDGDGDNDLIVGCKGGLLQYYENIGTPDSAIWQLNADYFGSLVIDTALAPKPQLVDLDGDSLRELYLGFTDNILAEPSGMLLKYINAGTPSNPLWQSDSFNIGYDISGLGYPQFIDYDYDGDYDLILHSFDRDFNFYENIGDSHNPIFSLNDTIFESFSPLGAYVNIALVDLGGDSKYELVAVNGYYDGRGDESGVDLYVNIGTIEQPIWQSPEDAFMMVSYFSSVAFADLDNDNDQDMLIGNHRPPLFYKENMGTADTAFFPYSFNGERQGPIYIYKGDNIHLLDFDNDNDLDFVGFYEYVLWPIGLRSLEWVSAVNIGNQISPDFSFADSFTYPTWRQYRETHVSSGDINNDGFKELILNLNPVSYIINDSGTGYDWGPFYDLGLSNSEFTQNPELLDLNNDNLLDIVVRKNNERNWKCFRNIGTPSAPTWQENASWITGIDSNIISFRGVYLNNDNKIDLVGTDSSLHLKGFLNTGTSEIPSFVYDPLIMAELNDYSVRYFDCADLDGDSDDDIVIDSGGVIIFAQNIGNSGIVENSGTNPDNFILVQSYPNPFNSSTIIEFELPKTCLVKLEIYDILGRKIDVLKNEILPPGIHRTIWRADNTSSGIYFCRLHAGDFRDTHEIILVK